EYSERIRRSRPSGLFRNSVLRYASGALVNSSVALSGQSGALLLAMRVCQRSAAIAVIPGFRKSQPEIKDSQAGDGPAHKSKLQKVPEPGPMRQPAVIVPHGKPR